MPLLKADQKFGEGLDMNRWLVVRKIGEGQFAEVYEVIDLFEKDEQRFAIKMEKRKEKTSVRAEAKVLKRLQDSVGICKMLGQGTHREHFYIHMELLGLNFAELRREKGSGFGPDGRCSMELMRRVGLNLLEPLAAMHGAGFIHRDVKPANFVAQRGELSCETATFRLVDFGLSRRFVDDSHQPMPERLDTAFRGSTTYASVNAHLGKDLSRRDDLWSWLYILVEMLDGSLPWRRDREDGQEVDRELVLRSKQACMEKPLSLASTVMLPDELASVSAYLASLDFMTEPDYEHVRRCLKGEAIHSPAFVVNGNSPGDSHHTRDGNVGNGPNEEGSHKLARADSRLSSDDAPAVASTPTGAHKSTDRSDVDLVDPKGDDRDPRGSRDVDRDRERHRSEHNTGRDVHDRDRDRDRDPRDRDRDSRRRDPSSAAPDMDRDRDRERDRDRNRGRPENRKRDHRADHRSEREVDREHDHRSDRDRRGDHRDYDGPSHRGHEKESGGTSARDHDRGSRDSHHASSSAKRPRQSEHADRASPSDRGASDPAARGADKHDRKRGPDNSPAVTLPKAPAPAPVDRSAQSGNADHSTCHPSRVMELRDAISIVADGTGPSGNGAAKIAQALVDLHAGEALGAIGLAVETLLRSTSPEDAEISARWLEALSCYTGDAAALAWDKRHPPGAGGST